jgi:hypothetical protein
MAIGKWQSAKANPKSALIGMFRVSPLDLGMTGEGWGRADIAEIAVIARHRRGTERARVKQQWHKGTTTKT